jgi:DNA polymerase-1
VFNVASPAQLSVVLYELLRLPARTKDGKLTTDERALKSLLAECGGKPEARELIQSLLRLGKLDTIASILERIAPGDDGRIRTVYNPAGTETGRFASSETFLVRSTNLSNMPKREATEPMFDVRRCFIPDPGCVFVEADYSGAEMWIAAACAQDEEWLHMLRTVPKIHRWHAMQLFGLAEAEVTEQEYMKAKTAGFALNYGMQWKTFMENVNAVADRTGVAITAREAKLLCTRYVNRVHPSLPRWWDALLGELVRTGTLTTCFSRRRTFYGRNRGVRLGETHREAIAHEPQSTIADLLNRGLLRWWRQHDGHVGLLLAQVYDSLLIQARREQAQLCATLVRRCLTEEIEVHGIRLTVPVDVKVLESWAVRAEAQTC